MALEGRKIERACTTNANFCRSDATNRSPMNLVNWNDDDLNDVANPLEELIFLLVRRGIQLVLLLLLYLFFLERFIIIHVATNTLITNSSQPGFTLKSTKLMSLTAVWRLGLKHCFISGRVCHVFLFLPRSK